MVLSQTFPIGAVTHQVDRLGRPNMRMAKKRKAESHTARPVRNVEKQFRSCGRSIGYRRHKPKIG